VAKKQLRELGIALREKAAEAAPEVKKDEV